MKRFVVILGPLIGYFVHTGNLKSQPLIPGDGGTLPEGVRWSDEISSEKLYILTVDTQKVITGEIIEERWDPKIVEIQRISL